MTGPKKPGRSQSPLVMKLTVISMVLVAAGPLLSVTAYPGSAVFEVRISRIFRNIGVFVIVAATQTGGSLIAYFVGETYVVIIVMLLARESLLVEYGYGGGVP
jgi:hypothetical protein